ALLVLYWAHIVIGCLCGEWFMDWSARKIVFHQLPVLASRQITLLQWLMIPSGVLFSLIWDLLSPAGAATVLPFAVLAYGLWCGVIFGYWLLSRVSAPVSVHTAKMIVVSGVLGYLVSMFAVTTINEQPQFWFVAVLVVCQCKDLEEAALRWLRGMLTRR